MIFGVLLKGFLGVLFCVFLGVVLVVLFVVFLEGVLGVLFSVFLGVLLRVVLRVLFVVLFCVLFGGKARLDGVGSVCCRVARFSARECGRESAVFTSIPTPDVSSRAFPLALCESRSAQTP